MRILLVIPSITNYYLFLEDLAGALHAKGHEVHLITSMRQITETNAYKRGMVATLHPVDLPRALNLATHLRAAKAMRQVVNDLKPDLISVHFSAALFTAAIARTPAWPATVGTVHGLGSPIIGGWRKWAIAMAEDFFTRRLDTTYVLTEDDRQWLSQRNPAAQVERLRSFGLGCDLSKFQPARFSPEFNSALRQKLGIFEDDTVFAFVGRQTYFKGFDKVIRAFMQIYPQDARQKLLLIGSKDKIHRTHLSRREYLELQHHPGIISVGWQEDVAQYLSIAHINVFPSQREGLPVNLMESLAMGIPVITTNARGNREVVQHLETGLVLSQNSQQAIAEAMAYLRDHPEVRAEMQRNAMNRRENFNRDLFVADQFEIIASHTNQQV